MSDSEDEHPAGGGAAGLPVALTSATSMGAPPSGYLSRQTGEELKSLNAALQRELVEKEEEIARLEASSAKGLLQQKLQRALQENKDLRKRLDEVRGYQSETASHAEDSASLLAELASVKSEMTRSKADYESLLHSLESEREQLKDDLHACETKIGAYERETNELEEEAATTIQENDALKAELATVRTQLAALRTGGRVNELEEKLHQCTLLLQSKEAENDALLREMDAVTHENEQLRALQHEHIQEVRVQHAVEQTRATTSLEERQEEIVSLKAEIAAHIERGRKFEAEKAEHDSTVLDLRNKMREYELQYGLTDAVAEIRTLKTQLKKQQLDRAAEKELVNRRERDLQRFVAENRNLKQLAGITDPAWGLDPDELQLQGQIELQKLQALRRTDTKIIKKLEEDRLELLDELRKGATDRTRDGLVYLGLDADKTRLLEEYVERLRNGDASLPQSDAATDLQHRLDQATSEVDAWKERYARGQVEKDELASKLMSLMERDKTMAYDQILKQITDLKVQYNLAQLSATAPIYSVAIAAPPTMPGIPESPANGLRSPTAARPPQPLPANASSDLRQAVERANSLALPERHALFARLFQEFQPAQQQQQAYAPAALLSPSRSMPPQGFEAPTSSNAAQGAGGFTFPASATDVPAGSPQFDPAAQALSGLDTRALNALDPASKARLVGCLTDLLAKERENHELLDSLELYQVRFEKLAARQQMLYLEHNAARASWAEEKEDLYSTLAAVREEKDKVDLQLAKVGATRPDALSNGDDAVDAFADETETLRRRVLVLQTNEKVLARRYNSLEAQHATQTASLESVRREFVDMEHTLRLRVQELAKRKKLLEARCTSAQQLVATWVPKEELLKMARKYNWMSNRYADAIARQDLRIVEANNVAETRRENENLRYRVKEVEDELALQTTRCVQLREALDAVETTMIPNPDPTGARAKKSLAQMMASSQAAHGSSSGTATPATSTTLSIPALIAELADLRARETSATKRCARLDENLASLNQHSLELESDLLTIRKKHHELSIAFEAEQEVVLDLRNRAEGGVPYFKVNQLQQQLLEAQERLVEAQAQVGHFKEIADLANHQSVQLLNLRPEDPKSADHDSLVRDLQETIASLESSSDDAARIGRVHRENMNLKLAVRRAEKEVAELRTQGVKLAQQHALLERELDIKHTDLYRLHNHARSQISEREKTILDLTSHATAGNPNSLNHPMTLQQAETIHQATLDMQHQLEAEKKKSNELKDQNDKYYLEVAELKINLQQARELAAIMPSDKALKSSQRGGRNAAAPLTLDDDDDPFRPALPASLSLLAGSSTVVDQSELSLRLRQNLVKYSNEISRLKLAEVKSAHLASTLQAKVDFQSNEITAHESRLAQLQQQLVEKDLYITQKENDFQEQYLHLKEQETKLKLAESIKRMDATKTNKRQQQNAVATLKRVTDQANAGPLNLGHGIGEEDDDDDPFAVHDDEGRKIDVDNLDVESLMSMSSDLDAATSSSGGGTGPRLLESLIVQLQGKLRLARQVMADQKERMYDLEQERDRITALKQADSTALASAHEVASAERARLLSTAQATLQSLTEQLATKNARIEKYQSMLEQASEKFKARKLVDEAEIERLNHALLDANTQNMGRVTSAINFLDEMPRLPKDVVSRVEMEDVMKEKERVIGLMQKEIEFLKIKCNDEAEARDMIDQEMKNLYASSRAEIDALQSEVTTLQSAKQDDAKMAKLVAKLRQEMSEKDAAAAKMETAMAELKDAMVAATEDYRKMAPAASSSKEDAGTLIDPDLRKQVATLERKLKAAAAAVAKEQKAARDAKDAALAAADGIAQKAEQMSSLETAHRQRGDEMDALRLKLIQSQNETAKVKETHLKHKARVAKELDEIKAAHEKEKDLAERRAKLAAKSEGSATKELAASKERARGSAAPTAAGDAEEKDDSAAPSSSSAAVASKAFSDWESEKKASKKVALLQAKIQKHAGELRSYQDAVEKVTRRLEKEQKEKIDLFQKFTALQAQLHQAKQLSASSLANLDVGLGDDFDAAGAPSGPLTDADLEKLLTKESLKQKVFDLQATNDALQRRLQVDVPAQAAQLKEDVAVAQRKAEQLLRDKRDLERAVKESAGGGAILKAHRNKSSLPSQDSSPDSATIASLESQLSASEQRVLDLTMANLDLKYSAEHGAILVARLRTRLQEMASLMRLVDGNYLAREWQDLVPEEVRDFIDAVHADAGATTGPSASGASASDAHIRPTNQHRALTLILSTFKKIFEKLKHENESLKKNSQSNLDYMNTVKENKQLKKKLQLANAAVAAAEAAVVKEKAAASASSSSDHDAGGEHGSMSRAELERAFSLHTLTRKDLKKEQETTARLKKKLAEAAKDTEAAQTALAAAEQQIASSRSSSSAEFYRKEKNYLASIADLQQDKAACEDEIRRLKSTLREMKSQMGEMSSLIAHVRAQQTTTQEQVLAAAQVQAAVLSKAEADDAREKEHAHALRTREAERDALARENAALKHELSAFDAQFFEELEDLKYRYAQAVEQVRTLNQQIEEMKAAPPA